MRRYSEETYGHDLPYTLRVHNILACFMQKTDDSVLFQRAIHRPRTAENQVLTEASSSGICGKQSCIGRTFSPNIIFPPCQYYSINAPYSYFFFLLT